MRIRHSRPKPRLSCTQSLGTTLIDGNKRLALSSLIAFLGLNGHRLTLSNDEAYMLVMSVAEGGLEDIEELAGRIRRGIEPR